MQMNFFHLKNKQTNSTNELKVMGIIILNMNFDIFSCFYSNSDTKPYSTSKY